ncbi:MAG: DUF6125 family protein [Desulfobacterales bacterium]
MLNLELLSKRELVRKLKLAMDIATAVDGMWFLAAEEQNGYQRALEMDINVWKRYPKVLKKRISKYYKFNEVGLDAIKGLIEHDPMMVPLEFEFITENINSMIFQVSKCPALEAMERMGRKKLTCEPVETAYLNGIAGICDGRIEVEALKLPPRLSDDEICCQWRFLHR